MARCGLFFEDKSSGPASLCDAAIRQVSGEIQFLPRRALIRERGFDSVDGRFSLEIYLVDGTYELFRHYFAVPSARDAEGREVGAVRGVLASLLGLMKEGVTHVAVATDHVIESFRNDLYAGYKTGEGVAPDLLSQFPILEEVLGAAGIVVWPMVEFEADDALAAATAKAAGDKRVDRVIICTPDK